MLGALLCAAGTVWPLPVLLAYNRNGLCPVSMLLYQSNQVQRLLVPTCSSFEGVVASEDTLCEFCTSPRIQVLGR